MLHLALPSLLRSRKPVQHQLQKRRRRRRRTHAREEEEEGKCELAVGGVNHESAHTYNIPIPKIGLSWFWEVIGTFNPGNPLKAPLQQKHD